MNSADPGYCPICGNLGVPSTSSGLSSGTSIFQCFLNLFQANWEGKTFSFCELCKSHLVLISDLQKKLQVLEGKIKSHEKELQTKFSSSEVKFERNKLYEKDRRYLRFRKYIRTKVILPEPDEDDNDDYSEELEQPQPEEPFPVNVIKIEAEDDPLSPATSLNFEDAKDNHQEVGSEEDKPDSSKAEDKEMMEEDSKSPPESPPSPASEMEEDGDNDDDYIPSDSNQDDCEVKIKPLRDSKFTRSADGTVITIHNIRLLKEPSSSGGEPCRYRCSECNALLPNRRHILRSHVIREHTTLHVCPHCFKRFDKASRVIRHIDQIHKKVVSQLCPICSRPFAWTGPIDDHIWSHYSPEEKAERIAKGEKIPVKRKKKHVKQGHSQETSLCGVCGKEIRNLKQHMKLRHTAEEEMNFECEICQKKFTLGGQLSQHMKIAHVDGHWKCEVCGKVYKHEKYLKEHMKAGHEELKPFTCHVCAIGFSRKDVMKRHIQTVHEGMKRVRKGSKNGPPLDKDGNPWKCGICEKVFKFKGYLKEHMGGHAEVKPFICSMCGIGFSRKNVMQRHIKSVHERVPRLDKIKVK